MRLHEKGCFMQVKRCLLMVWVLSLICGCAEFEQYPHPYVAHNKLPFTQGPVADPQVSLQDEPGIAVCDLQSQVVSPVGAYFVENQLQRPIDLEINVAALADVISRELAASGATTVRIVDPEQPSKLDSSKQRSIGAVLRGTVVRLEYSQHGLKRAPYQFLYMTVRFTLERASDGQGLWEREITVYRKISPDPSATQASMAGDAIRIAAQRLANDDSFRSSLGQSRKGY